MSTIENLHISFPVGVEEQLIIASYLYEKTAQIDNLIAKKQKLIQLLKEERTAVINEAVSGEGKNWGKRRLSTLGKFFKGSGIKKDETKEEGLPCIRYGEIYTKYDRIVYKTKSFIDEETSKSSEVIKKGDVLFAGSGETIEDIGKAIVYFGDNPAFAGGDIIVLRLKNSLEPTYASYLMNAYFIQHQKSLSGKGEIIVHIYPKNIREITIPLPGIKEQIKIVTYLDKRTNEIDSTISKIEKEIELLQEYRTALISEVVTGKIKVTGN
jgi:type I restriction enzyme S subunit